MIFCSHIFLSFLHQVLPTTMPTTTISTTPAPTSPCPQMAGAVSGKTCIFPFTYKGVVYSCCSTADEPNNRPWCPLVHAQSYTGQAGINWDYCRKFIHKFGGRYRDLKTKINHACWDILAENEKMETVAKWMPVPPFFVGGGFEDKLLKLKIYMPSN